MKLRRQQEIAVKRNKLRVGLSDSPFQALLLAELALNNLDKVLENEGCSAWRSAETDAMISILLRSIQKIALKAQVITGYNSCAASVFVACVDKYQRDAVETARSELRNYLHVLVHNAQEQKQKYRDQTIRRARRDCVCSLNELRSKITQQLTQVADLD